MKLRELYNFFIEYGIKNDPRGEAFVKNLLKKEQDGFQKLSAVEKEDYDSEKLSNPYLDSRILYGTGDEEVKSIIAGIDIETSEVLLADTLKAKGIKLDLILTHHPEGHAYATFYKVMGMQADIFHRLGVPINVAEKLVDKREREVGRKVMPQNHSRAVDAAKLLGIPFVSAHTVADNQVSGYLQKLFDEKSPSSLADILSILKAIP